MTAFMLSVHPYPSTGQLFMHMPQPLHNSVLIRSIDMDLSPFFHRPNKSY